jgi:hypothetical protein
LFFVISFFFEESQKNQIILPILQKVGGIKMARIYKSLNIARDVSFAAAPKPTASGGKTVQMGFEGGREQVKFRLFSCSRDVMRAPWGVERPTPMPLQRSAVTCS